LDGNNPEPFFPPYHSPLPTDGWIEATSTCYWTTKKYNPKEVKRRKRRNERREEEKKRTNEGREETNERRKRRNERRKRRNERRKRRNEGREETITKYTGEEKPPEEKDIKIEVEIGFCFLV
jgi:hypothetical protein